MFPPFFNERPYNVILRALLADLIQAHEIADLLGKNLHRVSQLVCHLLDRQARFVCQEREDAL